ncbi:MAG: hypothetical protein K6A72_09130 [Lachnospiraceae bacterium]|nr:hypothetical protein [Lachnospiraceae bacterium]
MVVIDKKLDYQNGRICFTDEYINQMWHSSRIERRNAENRDSQLIDYNMVYEDLHREFGIDLANASFSWLGLCRLLNNQNEAECVIRSRYFARYVEEELYLEKKKYRILLTRGLRKCYIYAMNENLRNHLKAFVNRI